MQYVDNLYTLYLYIYIFIHKTIKHFQDLIGQAIISSLLFLALAGPSHASVFHVRLNSKATQGSTQRSFSLGRYSKPFASLGGSAPNMEGATQKYTTNTTNSTCR